MNKKSAKTAFCGVASSLSVVLLLLTSVLPFLTYIVPIAVSLLIYATAVAAGKKWALGMFFCTGILSLLLLTDKEAALTYLLFFGYYPLLKEPFERMPKALCLLLKYSLFNAAIVGIGFLGVWLFGFAAEDYTELGRFTIPIYLVLANITFALYDFAFTKSRPRFDLLLRRFMKRFSHGSR